MHDERMDSGGGVRRRRSGEGDDEEPLIEDSVIVGLAVRLTVFFFLDFLLALDGPGMTMTDITRRELSQSRDNSINHHDGRRGHCRQRR